MTNLAAPDTAPVAAPAPPPPPPARRLSGLLPPRLALAATAVLLALLAGVAVWQARAHQRDRAEAAAHNLARQLEAPAAAALMQADLLLQVAALAWHPPATATVPVAPIVPATPPAPALLQALAATAPELGPLRLADAAGHWLWSLPTNAPLPAGNAADREEFQRARADHRGGLIITGPLRHHASGPWLLVLSRAMLGADGRFAGLASVDLPVTRFDALFSAVDLGEHATVALRTEPLALVYRRPWPREGLAAVGSTEVPPALRDAIAANPMAGSFAAAPAPDGTPRINVYRRLQDYPLLLQLGVAEDEFAPGWTAADISLLALAGATLGGLLFSTGLQQRAGRQTLAEARRQLASHDALTALPSRHLLLDRLHRAQQTSHRLGTHAALLLLTLERPALPGAPPGPADDDPRRVAVAQRLQAAVRRTDTVARLGDDTFVVVCEHLGADAAGATGRLATLVAKISAGLAGAAHAAPGVVDPGLAGPVSVGTRLFSGMADPLDQLLADAEAAMALHRWQRRPAVPGLPAEQQADRDADPDDD